MGDSFGGQGCGHRCAVFSLRGRSGAAPDPYTTTRKVFAVGARANEVPLPALPETLVGQSVEMTGRLSRKARQVCFRRLPWGAFRGFAPLCLDANDFATMRLGLAARLCRITPPPEGKLIYELEDFTRRFCRKYFRRVKVPKVPEWLAAAPYTVERKLELLALWNILKDSRPSRGLASKIVGFKKNENYTSWKFPRWINSRSDWFKVYSGPFFKAIEEEVFRLEYFIKHTPVAERPGLIGGLVKSGARYYITDYTAYESHFIPFIMSRLECVLYRHCLADYPADADFICKVLTGTNRIRTHTGFKADVKGRRMSGDMCTSLGNGFSNLMLTLFVAEKSGVHVDGFVEGDDGIFAADGPLDEDMYERLGFTIKIEQIPDPREASFCGMIFGESGQIIRDPRAFLSKFGWTGSYLNTSKPTLLWGLLRAKALSALYETPHCPVVGAVARRAIALTSNHSPVWVEDGYHTRPPRDFVPPPFEPTQETRLLFERRYGIPIAQQLRIESSLDGPEIDLEPPPGVADYAGRFLEVQ